MCSTHSQVKALFAQCRGLALPPLIDMEVLTHILNGWTKNVATETSNPFVEREFVMCSQAPW
jgi:hypothetical protein